MRRFKLVYWEVGEYDSIFPVKKEKVYYSNCIHDVWAAVMDEFHYILDLQIPTNWEVVEDHQLELDFGI